MKFLIGWLFLSIFCFAQAGAIASRRTQEKNPLGYHFGPLTPVAYDNSPGYSAVPDAQMEPSSATTDLNQFAATGDFTVLLQTTPAVTFSVASNIGTLTTGTGTSQTYVLGSTASSFSVPDAFVSVEVTQKGTTSGTDHIAVGIASATVQMVTECDVVGNNCFLTVYSGGSYYNPGGFISVTLPAAPFYLGFSLSGAYAGAWYRTSSGGWNLISFADITANYDPRSAANLSGLQACVKLFTSQSTTWKLANLQTGVYGGVGIRDTHLVTYPDGRPYSNGSTFYLLATVAGAVNNDTGSANMIFSFDPATPALTALGTIGTDRDSGIFEDQSGQIIYDPQTNTERLVTSSWGNTNTSPVIEYASQSISTDDWLSSSVHTHVTPAATTFTLPGASTSYDPSMVCNSWDYSANTCGNWLLATATGTLGSNQLSLFSTTSDPSANTWSSVAGSLGATAYEGGIINRTATGSTGVQYFPINSGPENNEARQSQVFDATGTTLGDMYFSQPTGAQNPAHPQLLAYGNTEYWMTFSDELFGTIAQTMGTLLLASTPKYSGTTDWPYLVNEGSGFSSTTSVSSETVSAGAYSSTITVSVGDLIVGACRGGNNSESSVTVSDSLGNTVTNMALNLNGAGFTNGFYYFATIGGADTFTCTLGAASQSVGLTVEQISPGFLTSVDYTGYSNQGTSSATYTSGTFSTTAKGLVIACPDGLFGGGTFQAGRIGSYYPAFGAGLSSGAAPCEGTLTDGAQTNITASMTSGNGTVGTWGGVIMSFK